MKSVIEIREELRKEKEIKNNRPMMKIDIHIDRKEGDPERSFIEHDIIGDEMDQQYIKSLMKTLKNRIGTAAGISRAELKKIKIVIEE